MKEEREDGDGDGEIRVVGREKRTHITLYQTLVAGVVVDVDGDAAQGGDFARELVEARVVLALERVGVAHF